MKGISCQRPGLSFHLTKPIAVFVLVCAPCATGGITFGATATWTGGGGDMSWANWQNWNWDQDDCNKNHVVPGTITDPTSDCYNPAVNIPDGMGTVNQDASLMGYITNFTLGSSDVLNGSMSTLDNVTISGGAVVNGAVSASQTTSPGSVPGTLTNNGTINLTGGAASGCTIVNSGTIIGYGSIFTHTILRSVETREPPSPRPTQTRSRRPAATSSSEGRGTTRGRSRSTAVQH